MRKDNSEGENELEPLVDRTESLTLRSKRTERAQKKQGLRIKKRKEPTYVDILDLPLELAWQILCLCRPSDILSLAQVNRRYHAFITGEETRLAHEISNWRYECLERCFRLPVLMKDIAPSYHEALLHEERQELLVIHKKPYQHVQPPDTSLICTCLTCVLRWSALCLIVDFAHWQDHLDKGEPITMIRRGHNPKWNTGLIDINAAKVRKALARPMWHARLLEEHLRSTTRSIGRHAANKGNKRRHFHMSRRDADSGTDLFLELDGPPTFDFPFHRDNYYMLEAYLPNRGWNGEERRWMYASERLHDIDLAYVDAWAQKREREGREKGQQRAEGEDAACGDAVRGPETSPARTGTLQH